jgi:hypothetical protein
MDRQSLQSIVSLPRFRDPGGGIDDFYGWLLLSGLGNVLEKCPVVEVDRLQGT